MADETEVETVVRIQAVDIRDLYPELCAQDVSSRTCLLCSAKLKDKTHNLTRHLERHHAGALLQLLEQRNEISPKVLVSKRKHVQPKKSEVVKQSMREDKDTQLKVGNANLALAKWLAQEQLPVDLINNSSFRQFTEELSGHFNLPTEKELRQLLKTLMNGRDTAVEQQTIAKGDAMLPVDMLALKATSRCNEDSPLVSCSRIVCGIVTSGEAKVKVLRATASLLDAQTCRGKVLGKNGVLGRFFVGIVCQIQPSVLSQVDSVNDASSIKLFDKVIPSPYDVLDMQEQREYDHQTSQSGHNLDRKHSGALAEYIVLPVSNLLVVPPTVPDDLALLSHDMSIVLSIASELHRQSIKNIAIVADGPSIIVSNLLLRYLHQASQPAPQNIYVIITSSASSSVWSQYASIIPLNIHQPDAEANLIAQQPGVVVDAIVDLIGSEASTVFATQLVQPMGCIVLVERSQSDLDPQSTIAMDMNSLVVKELEIVNVSGGKKFLNDALQYLATQVTNSESATELRKCLLDCVQFPHALHKLQTIPEQMLESRYLQVALT
ncbi:putative GroES-like superfamily protein [Plasmopara halstedii]